MKKIEYKIWDNQLKSWVGNPDLWTIRDMKDENYCPAIHRVKHT